MKSQNRSLLVAGSAAVGLFVVGAAVLRRLRRDESREQLEPVSAPSSGVARTSFDGRRNESRDAAAHREHGMDATKAERTRDDEHSSHNRGRASPDAADLPRPLRQAVNASRRVQGLPPPIPEILLDEFAARSAPQEPLPNEQRAAVSALVPPQAIAPDPSAAGEELADADAIELPVGQSADPDIARLLSQSGMPQPDSSGAALHRTDSGDGLHEETSPLYDDSRAAHDLSVASNASPMRSDDAYDAVAPDDLGAEWLSRATEASRGVDTLRREAEPSEMFVESGMSVVSEGSIGAADAERIESTAASDLDDDPESIVLEEDDLQSEPLRSEAADADGGRNERQSRIKSRNSEF